MRARHLGEKLSLEKCIKQCLGCLKCSQDTKKNRKTLKVIFKAIFNAHFVNLVSKKYFSYVLQFSRRMNNYLA